MKPLTPYLFFDGNAREAMEFYKDCFGGKLEVMTYAHAPEDACPGGTKPTEETRDKIMHACLTTGDLILMASDNPMGAAWTERSRAFKPRAKRTVPLVHQSILFNSAKGLIRPASMSLTFTGG
jgi:uncharacterized glyoxalase superfamily protein PhnB